MKEVQDVSVDTDVVLEKTALTITAADGLLYILNFQNPVTLLFWKTDRIPVGCSEW
jgi:frataxin-like iron-binding protein CyaY